MERLKIFKEFKLNPDELEKILGGQDLSTMDYGDCWICTTCIISTGSTCSGCTSSSSGDICSGATNCAISCSNTCTSSS